MMTTGVCVQVDRKRAVSFVECEVFMTSVDKFLRPKELLLFLLFTRDFLYKIFSIDSDRSQSLHSEGDTIQSQILSNINRD